MEADYTKILQKAGRELMRLKGKNIDIVDIYKPNTIEYAVHLAKIISKLSPIIANMLEFFLVKELNKIDWNDLGTWKRQDPDFPDLLFDGKVIPKTGFEVKAWFPLSTEITARFKDSQSAFEQNQTHVCMIVWLPEYVIYGTPKVIDVWIGSAKSLAEARDNHYHNPPDYLIFEPEDTSSRTRNLQQSNTNGYKFQGTKEQFDEAEKIVDTWGQAGKKYSPNKEYQLKLKSLFQRFPYRLDTNFSKMDRIDHTELEKFKASTLNTTYKGKKMFEWAKLITTDEATIRELIEDILD
jgi:hypothetical protein